MENIRYVEQLEAAEQYERERPQREAEAARLRLEREAADMKIAAKMRERLNEFTGSLNAAPPGDADVLVPGDVVPDALDGHRARPVTLSFGDPDALEISSERARQGFDIDGRPIGSNIGRIADPAARNPAMTAAEKELNQLVAESDRIDAEVSRLIEERNAVKDPAKVTLTAALDLRIAVKQKQLVQIAEKTAKNTKLRRCISTEVENGGAQPLKAGACGINP